MMLLVRGAAKGLAEERRIEAPVTWLNDLLRTHAAGVGVLLPTGIWVLLAMALLVAGVLRYTRFGRHLLAIGSNERTARLCGVRVGRCTVGVYAIEAALTGLAGVMQFAKLSVGDPTVAVGLELDVIAAVIIGGGSLTGGRGTVFGTLVGAVLMTVIQIGCSQRGLDLQPLLRQGFRTAIRVLLSVTKLSLGLLDESSRGRLLVETSFL